MVVNAGTTNANFTIEIRNQQGTVEDSAVHQSRARSGL
jgi:hypothetical protein